MLKYRCLVLDHDDTVVQSEITINYPYFCYILDQFRPGTTITQEEYLKGCFEPGFVDMCRQWYHFTEEELQIEHRGWKEYIRHHVPDPYEGIGALIRRYKEAGGIVCVVSQSAQENIHRDYRTHFGMVPDEVYGWDLEPEHRKPSPWALEQIMAKYNLKAEELLVVDDMKPAVQMARDAGCPIAFAGWGRKEFPKICQEMQTLCDFSFSSTEELADFLFI